MLNKIIEWLNIEREIMIHDVWNKPTLKNKIKFNIINYITNKF